MFETRVLLRSKAIIPLSPILCIITCEMFRPQRGRLYSFTFHPIKQFSILEVRDGVLAMNLKVTVSVSFEGGKGVRLLCEIKQF